MVIDAPHNRGTEVATWEKVRFLSSPEAYPGHPPVTVTETHMSWVFLAGDLVYKFKKPVRYPFLDFTSLGKRERHCDAELTLNRRLAPRVYRRLVALRLTRGGVLALGGEGEPVEWLIEMERLSADDMLDRRIKAGDVSTDAVVAIADKLGAFYASARPERRRGRAYIEHLVAETAVNRKILLREGCLVRPERAERIVGRVERLLEAQAPAIDERIADGLIIEGHGDLRPEHVHLGDELDIIDCLEFDRNMRLLDPYDEVNYLGLECEFLGAGWIRPMLLKVVDDHLAARPAPRLMATYGAFRAVLRARICIAHLLDPEPMEPERWPAEAERYLDVAERECARAED